MREDIPIRKKHIVLLVLSCVCLLISLSVAWDLLEYFLLPDAPFRDRERPSYPSDGGTGMGLFAVLLGEALRRFALFVLFAMLAELILYWCAGAVLSVMLVMNKHDKPKWLWGVSLGLAVAFGLIAAGLVVVWILA